MAPERIHQTSRPTGPNPKAPYYGQETAKAIRASTNNRVSTMLDMFIDTILEHGVPSRVRGDCGGEN